MVSIILPILIFITGFVLIFFGVDWAVDNARELIEKRNISPYILGAILLGVDIEEIIASATAAVLQYPTIAIGNAIGNNIIAMTIPLAIPVFIFRSYNVKRSPKEFTVSISLMILSIIFALLINNIFPNAFLIAGIVNLSLYAILSYTNIKNVKNKIIEIPLDKLDDELLGLVDLEGDENDDDIGEESKESNKKLKRRILIIIISIIMIIGGSFFLSNGLEGLVENIGIAQHLMGYIIIALGVNVEEFLLIYKSIKKNVTELGMGGIIMKSAWNLGITFGISMVIFPAVPIATSLFTNLIIFLISFIYLVFVLRKYKKLDLKLATGFLAIFIIYLFTNIFIER